MSNNASKCQNDLQRRLVESLELIGEFVTVEELRIRGNIVKPPVTILHEFDRMKKSGVVQQISGARWGLADWDHPDTPGKTKPGPKPGTKNGKISVKGQEGDTRRRVRELLDQGLGTNAIARQLGLEKQSVTYHLNAIRDKRRKPSQAGSTPNTTAGNAPPEKSADSTREAGSGGSIRTNPVDKPTEKPEKSFTDDELLALPDSLVNVLSSELRRRRAKILFDKRSSEPASVIRSIEDAERAVEIEREATQTSPPVEKNTMPDIQTHPAIMEINELAEMAKRPGIEDATVKLEFMRRHAAYLGTLGALEAHDFMLWIHNDLAEACGLVDQVVDIVDQGVKQAAGA